MELISLVRLIGCLLGFMAGYHVGAVVEMGITLAAIVVLMPKMVGTFIEGLNPVAEACQVLIAKRFKDRFTLESIPPLP